MDGKDYMLDLPCIYQYKKSYLLSAMVVKPEGLLTNKSGVMEGLTRKTTLQSWQVSAPIGGEGVLMLK